MKAINGPFIGKNYIAPKETNKIIDYARFIDAAFEVVYYRTKNGWAFHSWKNIYSLKNLAGKEK